MVGCVTVAVCDAVAGCAVVECAAVGCTVVGCAVVGHAVGRAVGVRRGGA